MPMPDGSFGEPYSLEEAREAVKLRKFWSMEAYYQNLMLWLISEVERLRKGVPHAVQEGEQGQPHGG